VACSGGGGKSDGEGGGGKSDGEVGLWARQVGLWARQVGLWARQVGLWASWTVGKLDCVGKLDLCFAEPPLN